MKAAFMRMAVWILNMIYLVFRPLKMKNRITIMSRQSNKMTTDIRLLKEALEKRNVETEVLTRRLTKSFSGGIKYGLHMLKQMYYISTSGVIVIDGYCILVSILPKKEGQKVVQIWHSLGAIKKFGYQSVGKPDGNRADVVRVMKLYRNYDYVIAPSETTAEIYSQAFEIEMDRIKLLGLPRIDYLTSEDKEAEEKIYEEYPKLKGKKVVLYLPTFRKSNQPDIKNFIEDFPYGKYNLVIKKHWLDKNDYSWAEKCGAVIVHSTNTMDLLKISDKVITDYSAVAFEAAIIDRELYFYIPDIEKYRENVGLNTDLRKENISRYVCCDEKELFALLQEPYHMESLRAFSRKYISVDTSDTAEKLTDFLTALGEQTQMKAVTEYGSA